MDYRARWQNRRRYEIRRRSLMTAALACGVVAVAGLLVSHRSVPLAWAYRTAADTSPLTAAAADAVYVATPGDHIAALRAGTGLPLWPVPADAPTNMTVAPVPAPGRIICVSDEGAVWALDRRTGQEAWRVETGAMVRCSAMVAGSLVLIGNDDGVLLALDLASGVESWRFSAGASISSRAALVSGLVVVAGSDGRVYGLDARTGRRHWSQALEAPVLADLAVVGSRVMAVTEAGSLCLLAHDSGYCVATAALPEAGLSRFAPLVDHTGITLATAEGWLARYAARDLEVVWQRKVADALCGGPVALGDRLYCPTPDGAIACALQVSGRPCRGWRAGSTGPLSLQAAGGLLVAALQSGRVVAYRPRTPAAK